MKTINSLSFLLSQYTFHDKVQRKKIHVNVIVDMIRSIKFSKCFFDTFYLKNHATTISPRLLHIMY